MKIDNIKTNLKGIKNGEATSIAIMLLSLGRLAINGAANLVYISSAKGKRIIKITRIKKRILDILDFNSFKWGIYDLKELSFVFSEFMKSCLYHLLLF